MIKKETIKKAVDAIRRNASYEYFFKHIQSPDWIEPLQSEGKMFSRPPQIIRVGKYIRFPMWPESEYLARMAELSPDIVTKVLKAIPDDHTNIRVYEDIIDAALRMPPNYSVKLVKKFEIAAQLEYLSWSQIPEKLGKILSHLVRGGFLHQALKLAKTLLATVLDSRQINADDDGTPRAGSRMNDWEYEQILKKHLPDLFEKLPLETFDAICELLNTFISASKAKRDTPAPEDYSDISRPAIENHEQNIGTGIDGLLIDFIRDFGELFLNANSKSVTNLFKITTKYTWKIFRRIELHLLRATTDSLGLISQHLLNKTLFNDPTVRHEYVLLLREYFGSLDTDQKEEILSWVRLGLDKEKTKKLWIKNFQETPTDLMLENHVKAWKKIRLAWFNYADLPEDLRSEYDNLIEEFGLPEHPEFSSFSSNEWVGPTSPKTNQELQELTPEEIIRFLKDWNPAHKEWAPSPNGLGRVLKEIVADRPELFANSASEFRSLDPTYTRSLIEGFEGAINQKKLFNWENILTLSYWIVTQPNELVDRTITNHDFYHDPDWSWARKSVANLLCKGFENSVCQIPFSFRDLTWKTLFCLTEDASPSPEDEQSENIDPQSRSINTIRGSAMHGVIQYSLWVRRELLKTSSEVEISKQGFKTIPEVEKVLDAHLLEDKSLAIRSIYGQWFPWLQMLDEEWTEKNVPVIFPGEPEKKKYWEAAWQTYILLCQPYDKVFGVLESNYRRAIDQLNEKKELVRLDSNKNLASHLMDYYYRGKLDDTLLNLFWERADEDLRANALRYISTSLYRTKGKIAPEYIDRLKLLWESRLTIAKKDPDRHRREMETFGPWLLSKQFNDTWSVAQLAEALTISGKIADFSKEVVNRLIELIEQYPNEVLQCLNLMVKGNNDGWGISRWKNEAKTLLQLGLKTSAKSKAREIINYFVMLGYFDFGDLLKTS